MDRAQARQRMLLNALIFIVILAAMSFLFQGTAAKTQFLWGEAELTVTDPEGGTYTLPYGGVTAVQLLEELDFGTCVDGGETKYERYGLWRSDSWGEYRLYCASGFGRCIVFYSGDGVLAMNCESAQATAALMDSVLDLLRRQGFEVDVLPTP